MPRFHSPAASKTADSLTPQQLSDFISQQKSKSYEFYSTGISKEKLEASAKAMASAYESAKSSAPDVKNTALGFISSWAEWASQAAKSIKADVPDIANLQKIAGSGNEYATALSSGRNYFAVLSASLNQKGIMALKENGVATLASALDDMALGKKSEFNFYQYKLTSDNAKIFSQVLSNLGILRVEQMAAAKYANIPGDAQIVLFEKQPLSYKPYVFKVEDNAFAAQPVRAKTASQPASSDVELASIIPYPTKMTTNTDVQVTQGDYSINDYKKFAKQPGDKLVSTETITVNKQITFDMPLAFRNNPDSEEAFYTIRANMGASFLELAKQLGIGTELPFGKFLKNMPEFRDMVQSMIDSKSLKITGSASSEYCNNIDDAEQNLKTARTRAEMVFTWLNRAINEVNKERQSEGKAAIQPVEYKPENLSQTIALWWEISPGDIAKIKKNTTKYALLNEYIKSYSSETIKKQRVDTFGLIYTEAKEGKQDAVDLWKKLTSGKSPAIVAVIDKAGTLTDVKINNVGALNQAISLKAAIASQSKFRSQEKTTLLERAFSINNSRSAYATMSLPGTISIEIDKSKSLLDVDNQYLAVSLTVKQTVKLKVDGKEQELIVPYTGNVPFVRLFSRTSDLKTNPEASPNSIFQPKKSDTIYVPVPFAILPAKVEFDKNEGNLSKYIAIFPLDELKVPEGDSRTFYGTVVAYATEKTDSQVYAMEKPKLDSGLVRMSMEATKKETPKLAVRIPPEIVRPKTPISINRPPQYVETYLIPGKDTAYSTSTIVNVYGEKPVRFLFGTGGVGGFLNTGGKVQMLYDSSNPSNQATLYGLILASGREDAWKNSIKDGNLVGFFQLLATNPEAAKAMVNQNSPLGNLILMSTPDTSSTNKSALTVSQVLNRASLSAGTDIATLWKQQADGTMTQKGIMAISGFFERESGTLTYVPKDTVAFSNVSVNEKHNRLGMELVYFSIPRKLFFDAGFMYAKPKSTLESKGMATKLEIPDQKLVTMGIGKIFSVANKFVVTTQAKGFVPIGGNQWGGVISIDAKYDAKGKLKPFTISSLTYAPNSAEKLSAAVGIGAQLELVKNLNLSAEARLGYTPVTSKNLSTEYSLGVIYNFGNGAWVSGRGSHIRKY